MLVKDKHTQCYDEIIKNGSLTPTFFCLYRKRGGGFGIRDSRFANSKFEIRNSRFPSVYATYIRISGIFYALIQRLFLLHVKIS